MYLFREGHRALAALGVKVPGVEHEKQTRPQRPQIFRSGWSPIFIFAVILGFMVPCWGSAKGMKHLDARCFSPQGRKAPAMASRTPGDDRL